MGASHTLLTLLFQAASPNGGEEFVSLLIETSSDKAQKVVEDVRRGVESSVFRYSGSQVAVTVSCGIAQFHSGDSPKAVLGRADDTLYRAKKNGRNRREKETF